MKTDVLDRAARSSIDSTWLAKWPVELVSPARAGGCAPVAAM